MKKAQFFFAIALSLLLSLSLAFAGHEFNVLTTKGDIKVKRENSKKWETLDNGQKLFTKDQIKIKKGAYLSLVHTNGNPIEVNKSGNYSVSKLLSKANTKKSDVTKKFTSFILDELAESDDLLSSGDLSDDMSTLGATERAFVKNGINIRLPKSTYLIDNKIDISWYELKGASSYKFTLRNPDDEVILSKELNSTELSINLDELKVENGECYYWSISADGKDSEEYCLFRMTTKTISEINNDVQNISNELGKDAALGQLVLASYYAEKKVVNKAIKAFKTAIEISPDVEKYKFLYAKYLRSLGLEEEASKAMN